MPHPDDVCRRLQARVLELLHNGKSPEQMHKDSKVREILADLGRAVENDDLLD